MEIHYRTNLIFETNFLNKLSKQKFPVDHKKSAKLLLRKEMYTTRNMSCARNLQGALISFWTSFLMFVLHDPSSRTTKPSYMI